MGLAICSTSLFLTSHPASPMPASSVMVDSSSWRVNRGGLQPICAYCVGTLALSVTPPINRGCLSSCTNNTTLHSCYHLENSEAGHQLLLYVSFRLSVIRPFRSARGGGQGVPKKLGAGVYRPKNVTVYGNCYLLVGLANLATHSLLLVVQEVLHVIQVGLEGVSRVDAVLDRLVLFSVVLGFSHHALDLLLRQTPLPSHEQKQTRNTI